MRSYDLKRTGDLQIVFSALYLCLFSAMSYVVFTIFFQKQAISSSYLSVITDTMSKFLCHCVQCGTPACEKEKNISFFKAVFLCRFFLFHYGVSTQAFFSASVQVFSLASQSFYSIYFFVEQGTSCFKEKGKKPSEKKQGLTRGRRRNGEFIVAWEQRGGRGRKWDAFCFPEEQGKMGFFFPLV